MTPLRFVPTCHAPTRRRVGRAAARRRGFTLVGIALALFILAVAAALGAPWLRRTLVERKTSAVVAELRQFAAAFQAYAHEHGDWPADGAAPGGIPRGMEPGLAQTAWQRVTPIGGGFRWARRTLQQGARFEAAIVISDAGGHPVTRDKYQLEEIDRRIDDGDVTTGRFRLGFRNQPVFVIEN